MNKSYEQYIHSAAWREKADRRLEQDNRICCVCGGEATEVHHLTYDHFREERPWELVSLCHRCHCKAEELYDPSVIPWAMDKEENFMAAMRADAISLSPVIFEYLKEVRGDDFGSLIGLRVPDDAEFKRYWGALKKAVDALCGKRYSFTCGEDRRDMMVIAIANRVAVCCLAEIEHNIRNMVQRSLHDIAMDKYGELGKWKDVCEALGVTGGVLQRLRRDDGTTFGPILRDTEYFYCGVDALIGNRPEEGFSCLADEDYGDFNHLADHAISLWGEIKKEG